MAARAASSADFPFRLSVGLHSAEPDGVDDLLAFSDRDLYRQKDQLPRDLYRQRDHNEESSLAELDSHLDEFLEEEERAQDNRPEPARSGRLRREMLPFVKERISWLNKNPELDRIRHSTAHVMAEAVLSLFPGTRIAIGPAIEDGFYYDFELPRPLKEEDLPAIEEKMRQIIGGNHPFACETVSREQARQRFQGQPYKLELIEELPEGEPITLYTQSGFSDLCRGPHVERTSQIPPDGFKLLSVAGAYWRGDEHKPMLTRIYGTAWKSRQDLEAYLKRLEEIERRDHRRLGKELDLFSIHEEAGAGLIYWHPKGGRIRTIVERFWRDEHYKNGYDLVYIAAHRQGLAVEDLRAPGVLRREHVRPAGHRQPGLLPEADELPLPHPDLQDQRCAPTGSCRCAGPSWARSTATSAPGCCTACCGCAASPRTTPTSSAPPSRSTTRSCGCCASACTCGAPSASTKINPYLATRPPQKSIGDDAMWEMATASLRKALETEGLEYVLDEGGGAFYGPKIDLKIRDALGREWQTTTIQFDFNLPERFEMTYMAADGTQKRPFMVHRALLGSMERFFGVLTEHYGGAFPFWLAPEQVAVIPVAAAFDAYARQVAESLKAREVRAEADLSDNRMNAKIRAAQGRKVPYMIVVGEREAAGGTLSVRTRQGEQINGLSLEQFLDRIREEEPQPGK